MAETPADGTRPVFLFGTLLHHPLFEAVAGEAATFQPARLPRHRVARVAGQDFPVMVAGGAAAYGALVADLSPRARARLDYYEAAFGYHPAKIEVIDATERPVAALAYLPAPGLWQAAPEDWSLGTWIADHGARTCEAAAEAMALHGRVPAPVMGKRHAQMLARADSRLRGAATPPAGGPPRDAVTLLDLRRPYINFFAAEELDLQFRRFDGQMSAPVERAVWCAGDAALVLPYDPRRDRVLLVDQFRVGPYRRGDPSPWISEPVAGRIDPGETAEEAARREAAEEAGVAFRALECITASYASPGTTTEHFHIFVGIADLPDDLPGPGGKADEDEDIRSHLMDWADFDARLVSGGFRLVPLELAGHWLARNRDRLRASA